jgi:hypothetical protein
MATVTAELLAGGNTASAVTMLGLGTRRRSSKTALIAGTLLGLTTAAAILVALAPWRKPQQVTPAVETSAIAVPASAAPTGPTVVPVESAVAPAPTVDSAPSATPTATATQRRKAPVAPPPATATPKPPTDDPKYL